jgi:hypothetical protein
VRGIRFYAKIKEESANRFADNLYSGLCVRTTTGWIAEIKGAMIGSQVFLADVVRCTGGFFADSAGSFKSVSIISRQ